MELVWFWGTISPCEHLKLDSKWAEGGDMYVLGVVGLSRSGGVAWCDPYLLGFLKDKA